MQVKQEAFELRYLAVPRLVDLCEAIDARYPFLDPGQLFRGHAVAFVDNDDVGVGDLQVCCGHVRALVLRLNRLLVQAQEYILCINKRDDTVQVDCTAQAIVDPEQRREIARVSETGGFEEDVVEGASTRHEGLDCIDAGVFDRAADAAIGQLEPLLRFLTVLGNCEGSLDIGGCMEKPLGCADSCSRRRGGLQSPNSI